MFYWREQTPDLLRGFTDVHGGTSTGRYATLNLGDHVGDDAGAVEINRRRVGDALALDRDRLIFMRQCHGSDVAEVSGPWAGEPPPVDALVSTTPGVGLAVLVADCTPVLLADEEASVVGAAHAGRPGLVAGVVPAVVGVMRDNGAKRIRATLGPSVCGRCYEVPAALRADVAQIVPEAATVSWTGTPAVDVAAGVAAQLAALGVTVQRVPGCTRERPDLYSYRRDQVTGRAAGVVALGIA